MRHVTFTIVILFFSAITSSAAAQHVFSGMILPAPAYCTDLLVRGTAHATPSELASLRTCQSAGLTSFFWAATDPVIAGAYQPAPGIPVFRPRDAQR